VSANAGRLDVLVRSIDDRLWWKRWDSQTGWTNYVPLGGLLTSNPAAASAGTARIDAFYVQDGAGLWYRQRPASRPKGDFDGDGRGDYARFRPSTNTWTVRPRTGLPDLTFTFSSGHVAGKPDDFDNDLKADPVVFNNSTTTWTVMPSLKGGTETQVWGLSSDVRPNGDYDGDGLADWVVYRPSTGNWHIGLSHPNTAGFVGPAWPNPINWGLPGTDIPVEGDYDGDGRTDLATYRPTNNRWYLNRSSAGLIDVGHGASGDVPIPADYDGDGKTDLTVFTPSTGVWSIFRSSDLVVTTTTLGNSSSRLVPKDYDGDGKSDVAIFNPSNGVWTFRPSSGGGDVFTSAFGLSTDTVF
jgi:hypothetical protein